MLTLIDNYERVQMRQQRLFRYVIECRGRRSEPDTNVKSHFTREQLDELAPLTGLDLEMLSREQHPPALTLEHMAERIAAAHQLKLEGLKRG